MHISSEHLGNLHKYKYSVIDVRYALTSLPGTTPPPPPPQANPSAHRVVVVVRACSPLSIYVLQPYWNYSIRFVPHWIAPNLVTLFG